MSKPRFMSAQHVDLMNGLLAMDADSQAECARLDRRYWMSYELADPAGTVWWSVEFNPGSGVRFSLAPPAAGEPVVLYRGDHRAVVEATRRLKQGESTALPVTTQDDLGVMGIIGPAFAAAGRAATIPSEFPES
jgi:hypothetical protein